jgi:hypothetical protein
MIDSFAIIPCIIPCQVDLKALGVVAAAAWTGELFEVRRLEAQLRTRGSSTLPISV